MSSDSLTLSGDEPLPRDLALLRQGHHTCRAFATAAEAAHSRSQSGSVSNSALTTLRVPKHASRQTKTCTDSLQTEPNTTTSLDSRSFSYELWVISTSLSLANLKD
ncbi:hypothetical protein VUR80DRAFT_4346 [Thermomyces stellatus]